MAILSITLNTGLPVLACVYEVNTDMLVAGPTVLTATAPHEGPRTFTADFPGLADGNYRLHAKFANDESVCASHIVVKDDVQVADLPVTQLEFRVWGKTLVPVAGVEVSLMMQKPPCGVFLIETCRTITDECGVARAWIAKRASYSISHENQCNGSKTTCTFDVPVDAKLPYVI